MTNMIPVCSNFHRARAFIINARRDELFEHALRRRVFSSRRQPPGAARAARILFFLTLVTGHRRSLNLKLSDTRVCEPQIRARLGTTAHFCSPIWRGRRRRTARGKGPKRASNAGPCKSQARVRLAARPQRVVGSAASSATHPVPPWR